MFQVKPNLTFQVDIGSAEDIPGITSITTYERAGLFVPGVVLNIAIPEDKIAKELWEGNTIKVLFGRDGRLSIFGEFVIMKVELRRETYYWHATVTGVNRGIAFSTQGKPRFFHDTSKNAIAAVLREHFQVEDEAKPTNDRMVWIQTRFQSNKAFVLDTWQHSWYPGNNALLLGIRRDGKAVITDLDTLASKEDVRIGTLKGFKKFIGAYSWHTPSTLSNAFNTVSVGEWDLKEFSYREHDHGYSVKLGIKDPTSFVGDKHHIYRYMVSENVHANYNAALAKNTEIMSKLSSLALEALWEVCPGCADGDLNDDRPELKLFQVVKFAIEEVEKTPDPKNLSRAFLPLTGKYIISAIETTILPGQPLTQSLTLIKDSYRS